jgi:hypothetical protein
MSETYYQMMRKTFVENEHVKRLFANPSVAWDVAATQENDGALYIIENLTEVAATMNEARESDFKNILKKIIIGLDLKKRKMQQKTILFV